MYTMIQQLVRQNFLYYAITVALRPDHETDLLAFPYFMKCTSKNYSASVKHVNLNVNDLLLSGRGQRRIQGTAVFADESIGNEDELILGLHHRME